MAAALANVDDRDSWRVHFADTMRGGQYVNNWRMAEIHAKEAPERVRELEAYGAVFDRTPDGRILQRNFGGHRYPRLAHVGDRTGLELIRTLQDHTIHLGVTVHMEHTVIELLLDDRGASAACSPTTASGGASTCSRPRRWCSPPAVSGGAYQITSNSWEGTGDGHALAYRAGAELIDMEFVQFHPTGMVWPPSVKGILVTEGVRGEGGVLKNSEGRRFMFDDIPDNYKPQTAVGCRRGLALHAGRQVGAPPARAADARPRGAVHQSRGEGRPRQPARRRLPRHRLDQGQAAGRRAAHIRRKLPSMYHQFKELADLDITQQPDGGRADDPLHHGRDTGGRRHPGIVDSRAVRRRRVRGRHQRREPPRRQLALRPHRLRQACGRVRGRQGPPARYRHPQRGGRGRGDARSRSRRSSAAPVARTPTRSSTTSRRPCNRWSASSAPRRRCRRRSSASPNCGRAPSAPASRATASTTPGGTPASTSAT